MFEIAISIVCYNNDKSELLQAVNSVLNSKGIIAHLYIIDNSPTDTLRYLFNDKRIEYIYNNRNVGFGAGHNIAIRRSISESIKYHLVLNPDVYFGPDVLADIAKYMNTYDVGLLMPKVINPDGTIRKIRRLLPTPLDVFGKFFLPTVLRKKIVSIYRTEFISYDKICSTPFLSGCFMFFRTYYLEKIGGFDERFFMYFEDTDISRRFYNFSHTVYYPNVCVVHLAHRDSHRNLKLLKIHLKSAILYFNKYGWLLDRTRYRINHLIKKSRDVDSKTLVS